MTVATDVDIRKGDTLRFRPRPNARWLQGTMIGVNADGSIDLCDVDGKTRSIHRDRLEVKRKGPRGGNVWVSVTPL